MNMTFVIATHNQHKLAELQRILEPLGINAVTADLNEVEETGTTFAENAFLKADAACKETGMPAVADDSGLAVDALNGAPGVYSARYAGEGATDEDRNNKLLKALKDIPREKRTARFVSSVSCVFPDGFRIAVEGTCEGWVGFEPKGTGGFGYDPVFMVGDRSYGEMDPSEKDRLSHRGRALILLKNELEKLSLK